jgi:hypothetical protein
VSEPPPLGGGRQEVRRAEAGCDARRVQGRRHARAQAAASSGTAWALDQPDRMLQELGRSKRLRDPPADGAAAGRPIRVGTMTHGEMERLWRLVQDAKAERTRPFEPGEESRPVARGAAAAPREVGSLGAGPGARRATAAPAGDASRVPTRRSNLGGERETSQRCAGLACSVVPNPSYSTRSRFPVRWNKD